MEKETSKSIVDNAAYRDDSVAVRAYFDFLRFSLNEGESLPDTAATINWTDMLKFADDQCIIGVLFHGIKRLKAGNPHPSPRELAKWGVTSQSIAETNKQVYADAYKAIRIIYKGYGHKSCLLKGQGNALMYPDPYMRQSGDIDLWIMPNDGETVTDVIRLCRKMEPSCKLEYHHADVQLPVETDVELHYRPSFIENLFYNRRLQEYFNRVRSEQLENIVELPDASGCLCVPTDSFNRIFQLSHIMKHFLFEGVGLRQIIDYYYLLRRGATNEEKRTFEHDAKWLGMWKFAKGVMYVLSNYLGLEEQYLLAPTDKRLGKFIMEEIMATGNFGFSDKRFSRMKSNHSTMNALYSVLKGLRFIFEFPAEALFGHSMWILWWHFYYRRKMERSLR